MTAHIFFMTKWDGDGTAAAFGDLKKRVQAVTALGPSVPSKRCSACALGAWH